MAKRLFIAINLPPGITALLQQLDPHIDRLRWIPPEQQHLTLSFLGDVPEPAIDPLREALTEVQVQPFLLPLQGVGSFNRNGRPSVVWVGVGSGHPHLFVLHRRIQDAVLKAGLEPDLKPFHPHVTVGRVRDLSRQTLLPFLRRHADDDFGLVKVTAFILYSSSLTPQGPLHTAESRHEL